MQNLVTVTLTPPLISLTYVDLVLKNDSNAKQCYKQQHRVAPHTRRGTRKGESDKEREGEIEKGGEGALSTLFCPFPAQLSLFQWFRSAHGELCFEIAWQPGQM